MAIPAADTDLRIVIRAIQETITDTKIPGTQAETHPLSELLTISDTVVFNTFCTLDTTLITVCAFPTIDHSNCLDVSKCFLACTYRARDVPKHISVRGRLK